MQLFYALSQEPCRLLVQAGTQPGKQKLRQSCGVLVRLCGPVGCVTLVFLRTVQKCASAFQGYLHCWSVHPQRLIMHSSN